MDELQYCVHCRKEYTQGSIMTGFCSYRCYLRFDWDNEYKIAFTNIDEETKLKLQIEYPY